MSVAQTSTLPADDATDALGAVLRDYMDVARRLQETHETLQREVERLRAELASKDRELERRRRLAALGELAAGVAHEVRNPLGAIQLYSGLLRSEVQGQKLEAALRLIDKIETGVQAIDGVVRDTLALAPRDGRLATATVQGLVARAVEVCQLVLEQHDVRLQLNLPAADVLVSGHPDGLQRVLVNLISNAAEASPRGGTVTVAAGRAADGQVAVRVADDGDGLSDEVLEKLFDPFFTTKEHGTGLGLTIAHRLVEAHGGTLPAGNRPTGGAEFVMALPAARGLAATSAPQGAGRQIAAA